MDNGKKLVQTNAILRYLSRTLKGRNDDIKGLLYPSNNPEVCAHVDSLVEGVTDQINLTRRFTVPIIAEYKKKDEHFINYITKDLPKYCAELEDRLKDHGMSFLCGSNITVADIHVFSIFLKIAFNDAYDN